MNTAKRKKAPESLDKRIKEMAEGELLELLKSGQSALEKVCKGSSVGVGDLGRLLSMHKTKSTNDRCVKLIAAKISKDMLASLAPAKTGQDAK